MTVRRWGGLEEVIQWVFSYRILAIVSAVVLSWAYLSTLYYVINIVGGGNSYLFFAEIIGAFIFAIVCSRVIPASIAVFVGAILLIGGLAGYLLLVPSTTIEFSRQLADTIALLTGLSVLRMTQVGIWVLGFTPAPVFISWYFFWRRQYSIGVVFGGAALTFFVLTGDMDILVTLAGVLGAVGAIGFGDFDRITQTTPQLITPPQTPSFEARFGWQLSRRMLFMVVVAIFVNLIPGSQGRPFLSGGGGGTLESNLLSASEQVDILGSIQLSPLVRFTVTAGSPDYWRVAAYDRYTGDGWVRTGSVSQVQDGESLSFPYGSNRQPFQQLYQVEANVETMPAVWKPIRILGEPHAAMVTDMGGLRPSQRFQSGDEYLVQSMVNRASVSSLQDAGTSYPADIVNRYLQVPDSLPDRIREFTTELVADADSPYEMATTVEEWLGSNKTYSLEVDRPSGDVANAFMFQMDAGYCTYFATTMVVMLRSIGIPARFVVGYTPGQRIGRIRWVVRGLNSHAWVEVFFPDEGWQRFDPTPSDPRETAERSRLDLARSTGEPGVDTAESFEAPLEEEEPEIDTANLSGDFLNDTEEEEEETLGGSASESFPTQEDVLYGAIASAGALMLAHQTGMLDRGLNKIWLRRTPSGSPRDRVIETWDRVEYLLSQAYRPRDETEPIRAYLRDLRDSRFPIDNRIIEIYSIYEQSHYGGRITEEDAETAYELFRELLEEEILSQ